jgi:spore coat protein U-like protein
MSEREHMRGRFNRVCGVATATGLLLFTAPTFAACRISSARDVSFGDYDVFSNLPNNNGVGSLDIKCTNGSSATVKLSNGLSNTFAPRTLRNGAHVLDYNLYTTSARNIVWGDGTGGTSVMSVGRNHSSTLDIFGQIPEGQDAAVGLYTDTIVVSVNF